MVIVVSMLVSNNMILQLAKTRNKMTMLYVAVFCTRLLFRDDAIYVLTNQLIQRVFCFLQFLCPSIIFLNLSKPDSTYYAFSDHAPFSLKHDHISLLVQDVLSCYIHFRLQYLQTLPTKSTTSYNMVQSFFFLMVQNTFCLEVL